jgi:DNA-binding LacI/PurR family transcriptional regulator
MPSARQTENPNAAGRAPAPDLANGGDRGPAMTDVARLAGVSHQTVSRVVNKSANVKPGTRMRVLAAIEELGYRRNQAARALVTGRTQTLGVVSLNSTLYGPASTLYGIEQAALESQYSVSVTSLRSTDQSAVAQAVGRLVDQGVEGIVVIAPLVSVVDSLAGLQMDLPVVAVEGDADADLDIVTVDQIAGAQSATEHLLACGHETVWHVAGPNDWLEARRRRAGWRATLERAGAEVPPPLSGDWSPQSGYEAGQLLARMPEAKAVFVANDSMALGVLRALHEYGRSVPGDVSLVGFDDIPEAAHFAPPLTTVRQDFGEVGRRSLALLLDRIHSGQRAAKRLVVETSLVVRNSTTAPKAR